MYCVGRLDERVRVYVVASVRVGKEGAATSAFEVGPKHTRLQP